MRALDGVDLEWRQNEVLGVVGESGCGKTTLARTLLGLEQPSGGELRFEGAALDRAGTARAAAQGADGVPGSVPVAQPAHARERAGAGAAAHAGHGTRRARPARRDRARGCRPRRPRSATGTAIRIELSGGQRQRVAIASALAPEPAGIVCDEPVSALDVSVRAQVLHLLLGLRRARGLALLLITHDIGLAWSLCDRVAVMYLGRVVELGSAADVLERPQHPYTQALIAVAPSTRPRPGGRAAILEGEVPDASRLPGGCRFHPRCPRARERCAEEDVAPRPSGAAGSDRGVLVPGHRAARARRRAYGLTTNVARPISAPNVGAAPLCLTAGHTYQT